MLITPIRATSKGCRRVLPPLRPLRQSLRLSEHRRREHGATLRCSLRDRRAPPPPARLHDRVRSPPRAQGSWLPAGRLLSRQPVHDRGSAEGPTRRAPRRIHLRPDGAAGSWAPHPVSYTHLTLPTILRVWISLVAVSLKTKK